MASRFPDCFEQSIKDFIVHISGRILKCYTAASLLNVFMLAKTELAITGPMISDMPSFGRTP